MKILVAVITYNEESNIERVLRELRDAVPDYDVVVVDNGSTDRTVEICRLLGVPCVAHAINTGSPYGTVMAYFMYADEKGYDVVCQIDGDGQHIPSHLPDLVAEIRNHGHDYVVGSRFICKEGFQSTFGRRVGIRFLSGFLSHALGQRVTDATSGFKAYSRSVINFFARVYRKEIYDGIQMMLIAHHHGLDLVEIPVKMRERLHGVSEFFSLYRSVAFPIKATLSIIAYLIQEGRFRSSCQR